MNLRPVELVQGLKDFMGELEWSQESTADSFSVTEEAIVRELDATIRRLWRRFIGAHGSRWTKTEDITPGSTTETALTAQDRFAGLVAVYDESRNRIPVVPYHQERDFYDRGQQVAWIREVDGTIKIGFTFPDSAGTAKVFYLEGPRRIIGKRGTVTGTYQATVPFWANRTSGYYSTAANYVESIQIVNGQPDISTWKRGLVTSYDGTTLVWATGTAADDVFWCVEPEWAPEEARDLIVIDAAIRLRRLEGNVPENWHYALQRAELDFRAAYHPDIAGHLAPAILQDLM